MCVRFDLLKMVVMTMTASMMMMMPMTVENILNTLVVPIFGGVSDGASRLRQTYLYLLILSKKAPLLAL